MSAVATLTGRGAMLQKNLATFPDAEDPIAEAEKQWESYVSVVKLQTKPWKDVADVKCWPRLAVDLGTYTLSTADDIKTEKARLVVIEKTFEQMLTRVRSEVPAHAGV